MTRKDYNATAQLLKQFERDFGQTGMDDIIDLFITFFREDNARFDERRFREACKI